jgi:hypothetical protein
MINPKGQQRGRRVPGHGNRGRRRHPIAAGDVVHIRRRFPTAFLVPSGKHITYVLVKFPAR